MKAPLLLTYEPEGQLADYLQELAASHRWLLRIVKTKTALLTTLAVPRPVIVMWLIDANGDTHAVDAELVEVQMLYPDVPVVLVSVAKLSDDERLVWSAARLNLGAKHVLFPPWTKLVLEDLAGGLLAASIRRFTGKDPPPPLPQGDTAIDLAEGVYEDED